MSLLDNLPANPRRLARLISIVEDGGQEARRLLAEIYPATGRAYVVGVTGPPGAGKSTLVNALALELLRRGEPRVAILAVDPSSPIAGGAILGDRIRMQALSGNPAIYLRSMASRDQPGGLARAAGDVIRVLDAAGFGVVIVETVGAGQAEVAIAREAHTTLVVEVPGLGDDIQAIKAGILEIADLLVVNKADREGAEETRRHLRAMLHLGEHDPDWQVPVLMTTAPQGVGVPELVDALEAHRRYQERSGLLREHERGRVAQELALCVQEQLSRLIDQRLAPQRRAALVERILAREIDPQAAAELLLAEVIGPE
jgi:LAO/AO transport system kinase